MKASPEIAAYLSRQKLWKDETLRLREVVLTRPLAEKLKWGKPCYVAGEANIALIQGFKSYFALLFFKGAWMPDEYALLVRHGENVHAGRQLRFSSVADIDARAEIVGAYLDAAIAIERQGLKAATAPPSTPEPPEWTARLAADPELRAAFAGLTPGRRRAYLLLFNAAKQAKTRDARIDKWRPRILAGKGVDD